MIEPKHPVLSITRHCAPIGVSRSAWYGPGKSESPLNLALMKLIDAEFMETPFYGSRQMARHLRNQGYCVGRKRIRRLMARIGLRAVYQPPRTTVGTKSSVRRFRGICARLALPPNPLSAQASWRNMRSSRRTRPLLRTDPTRFRSKPQPPWRFRA